jgi:hypothetical protein
METSEREEKEMKKEEILSIPHDALLSLCSAYDKDAGEYPDPCLVGRDVLEFFNSELEKVAEEEKEAELIEQLASLEHDQWISWAQSICSAETISAVRADRWERLWVPYAELTEKMKDQDRKWARKAFNLMKNYGKGD